MPAWILSLAQSPLGAVLRGPLRLTFFFEEAFVAVQKHGVGNWRVIADEVGISSCSPKSCCQRWKSKHQPNLITEPFCDLEDAIIIAALQVRLWKLPSIELHTLGKHDVRMCSAGSPSTSSASSQSTSGTWRMPTSLLLCRQH